MRWRRRGPAPRKVLVQEPPALALIKGPHQHGVELERDIGLAGCEAGPSDGHGSPRGPDVGVHCDTRNNGKGLVGHLGRRRNHPDGINGVPRASLRAPQKWRSRRRRRVAVTAAGVVANDSIPGDTYVGFIGRESGPVHRNNSANRACRWNEGQVWRVEGLGGWCVNPCRTHTICVHSMGAGRRQSGMAKVADHEPTC